MRFSILLTIPTMATRFAESRHLSVDRALALLNADASQSVMIGDRDRDVEAAIAAGVEGILMEKNGNLLSYVESLP